MEKVLTGGGNSRKLRRVLVVLLSIFMLAIGSLLLTACGESETEYYVILYNDDGVERLYAGKLEAGDVIPTIATPTKEATAEYTYTFAGWVDENGQSVQLTVATKNITAYASYTATQREYSLTINANGTTTYSYDKVSVVFEDEELTSGSTVHYGDLLQITINGTEGYDIVEESYAGLTKTTSGYYKVIGDVTISYTDEASSCTVSVLSYDKNTSLGTITTTYGTNISSQLTAPARSATVRATYSFDCWRNLATDEAVDVTKITSTMTIYASYTENLIAYTLTIANTAKVSVYNGDEEIFNGDSIYYGDTLTVVTKTTTGYHITALTATGEIEGETGDTTDISTEENYAFKVVGNMTIEYAETINTYSVKLIVDDVETSYTVEYGTDMTTSADFSSAISPVKTKDETYTYEFAAWLDKDDNAADLTYITSNITAYASFEKAYIEYAVTLTDRVTMTITSGSFAGEVYTSETTAPTIHYGDTFVATCDLADGYSVNKFTFNGTDITSGDTQTMNSTSGVVIDYAMQITFEAEKYNDLQSFTSFSGTSTILASACVDNGNTYSYTYIGLEEVSYSAVYSDFVTMSQVKNNSTSYTPNYSTSTSTLTTSATLNATSYITTALYKGMTIEFTVSANVTAMIFGLSTYDDIVTNATTLNWYDSTVRSDYLWYCPTYNFYAAEGTALRRLISGTEAYTTGNADTKSGKRLAIGTSVLNGLSESVTIRLVLNDELELYINGVKEDLFYTNLTGYTITSYDIEDDTAYYFSFASSTALTVTFNEFGYVDNSEWGYLQYLDGKTITILGDSITEGFYASDFTRNVEYTGTLRYSTQLATALGMEEDNLGEAGTVYVTGISDRESRISDAQSITSTSEIVVVLLGINDFYQAPELGEFGTLDTTTLYGATYALYSALATAFAGRETDVYICTPVPSLTDLSSTVTNGNGDTLQDYCDVIIEVATYFGFNVVDLYSDAGMESTDYVGTTDTDSHSGDVLHPNDSGHTKIAQCIYDSIIEVGRWNYV